MKAISIFILLVLIFQPKAFSQWDNRFTITGYSIPIYNSYAYAITAYHHYYFIGGKFKTSDTSAESFLIYDRQNRKTVKPTDNNEHNGVGMFLNGNWTSGNAQVNSLFLDGDDLWVGGTFNRAGNTEAWGIARYSITERKWYAINSENNYPLSNIYSIQRYQDKLFLAGDFITSGNDTVNHIIVYDLKNGSFEKVISGGQTGADNRIQKMLLVGNKLFVAGNFSSIGGIQANRIAILDLSTNTWQPLVINGNNGMTGYAVFDMTYENDSLFLAGSFSKAFGQNASNVAVVNLNTNTVFTPSLKFDHDIRAVVKYHDELFLAGWFKNPRQSFLTYNLKSKLITNSYGIGPYAVGQTYTPVYCMERMDDELIIGGRFDKIIGIELQAMDLATYNITLQSWCLCFTGSAAGLGADYTDNVKPQALAFEKLNENEIVVGGKFMRAGPCGTVNNIGILNKNTAEWKPLGSNTANGVTHSFFAWQDVEVRDIQVYGDTIYMVGLFNRVANSIPAKSFARYIVSQNAWKGYNNMPFGLHEINSMARDGQYMYLAGKFGKDFNVYYQTFTYLLKYDMEKDTLVSCELLIFQTKDGSLNYLNAVEANSSYLFAGGRPIKMDENCSIFGYEYTTGKKHTFPACNFFGDIIDMILEGDDLYIAGAFWEVGGDKNLHRLLKYDIKNKTYTSLLNFNKNLLNGYIRSIDKKDDILYLAGNFTYISDLINARRAVSFNLKTGQFIPFGTPENNGLGGVYDGSGGSRVRKVKCIDDDVWFGGEFEFVNGPDGKKIYATGIARWQGVKLLSVNEQTSSTTLTAEFSVFPNPSEGSFTIQCNTPSTFDIMDISGKIIESVQVSQPVVHINLQLQRGIYLIKNRENNQFQKIIIY